MDEHLAGLLELLLVFGGAIGVGLWELHGLRRGQDARGRADAAADADARAGSDAAGGAGADDDADRR